MKTSKLSIAFLVIALLILFFTDPRIVLILGFLYYSYKLLYKKEELSRMDRFAVIALLALFTAEILLSIYYSISAGSAAVTSGSLV
jgi:hypothetical protein